VMRTLCITTRGGPNGVYVVADAFPYLPGQYLDGESALDNDRTLVEIRIGDRDDITTEQQIYLDDSQYVINYAVEQRPPSPGP